MSGKKPAIWLFIALVLSAAIPVLLLGGWMAYITADQQRSYARRAATEALTQAAHRIESEIYREMQVANALANSTALDHGNLNDFYQEATRLVADRPLWETAALTKPDQEQVLNVLRPLGDRSSRYPTPTASTPYSAPRSQSWEALAPTSPQLASGWWLCAFRSFEEVSSATC